MLKSYMKLLQRTASDWSDDNAARLAAALAYYTVLSIAPMMVLAVAVAGLFFGEDAARGQLGDQLSAVVGPQAGSAIQTIIANAKTPAAGLFSTVIGVGVLFFGASGVFGELQASLNVVWDVAPKPGRGVKGFVQQRFFSFTMVLGVAFLLLVSLALSAGLSAVGDVVSEQLPGGAVVWQAVNIVVSLGMITVLFAMIYKIIPDAKIAWSDVWVGAFVTSLLFALGKYALGLYIGQASIASPYGAAGSLIVLVVWVYYAAQILLLGAEFTQAYARRFGHEIAPSDHATRVELVRVVEGQPEQASPASRDSGPQPSAPGQSPQPEAPTGPKVAVSS
jgi:membrane protein